MSEALPHFRLPTSDFHRVRGSRGRRQIDAGARGGGGAEGGGRCPVTATREPGGTAIGEQIRGVLLRPENRAMLAETETLLLLAARAQHVAEVIGPALARGEVVLCDRFAGATYAYQGYGRGLNLALLRQLQEFAVGALQPDLTLLYDLPVETGLARRQAAGDVNRLDAAGVDFHRRVRAGYLELAAADPDALGDDRRDPAPRGRHRADAGDHRRTVGRDAGGVLSVVNLESAKRRWGGAER